MQTAQELINKRRELWQQHQNPEQDKLFTLATADFLVNDQGAAIREEIQNNPEYLIEMFMVIVNKDRKTVPFFLNDVQQSFIADLNRAINDYKAGKRLSLSFLVLKGRQQGFTSVITAYQLACSITRRNFAGYTLADDADNTEAIFSDKAKYPYEQLPPQIKPTEKYNNRRELLFDRLNSVWRVATAGKKGAGRSKTLNFFHGSESGFWDNIIDMLASLGQALTKDSIKILESTANGYNQFKDLWDDDNDWECKFYEWWRTLEYRLNFENLQAEQEFKSHVQTAKAGKHEDTSREWIYYRCQWLLENAGLDWNQAYWYYKKWVDLKALVKQEYPCFAEEAFLASGRCVFDKEIIVLRIAELKKKYAAQPYRVGRFAFQWNDPETKDKVLDDSIQWVDDPAGFIRLYEEPRTGYPYTIGGDTKGEGKDFYSGTAINNITGNRCATVHIQLTNSKPFTWQMYCLGRYFNDALIGIEMNFNTGPIEELERLNYFQQYKREVYDAIHKKKQPRHGWKTDGNTRPLIIDNEIALVEDHIELFNDIPTLEEMLSFVYDQNNRPDAESGKHDDLLFSDMIGEEIRGQGYIGATDSFLAGDDPRRYRRGKHQQNFDAWPDDDPDDDDGRDPGFYGR